MTLAAVAVALVLAFSRTMYDPSLLARGLLVIRQSSLQLFVDTGGGTVAKSPAAAQAMRVAFRRRARIPVSAKYVEQYYHGLSLDGALGSDWLQDHPILVSFDPKSKRKARTYTIPLKIVSRRSVDAYVSGNAGGEPVTLLVDSGAIAWVPASGSGRGSPRSVNFVSSATYDAWRSRHPTWPVQVNAFAVVRESGRIDRAPAIFVPSLVISGVDLGPQAFVERLDSSTYDMIERSDGVKVQGDLGFVSFRGFEITLDYPAKAIMVIR